MKNSRSQQVSPFEQYADAIVVAATEMYRAEHEGVSPDPDASRVALVQGLGDMGTEALRKARLSEAEVNVGARVVARVAFLEDEKDSGGFKGVLAGTELFLTKIVERKYLEGALAPGGPVDRVRGRDNWA